MFALIQVMKSRPLLISWTPPTPSQSPRDPPRDAKKDGMENSGI